MKKFISLIISICIASTVFMASAADFSDIATKPENITAEGIYLLELGLDKEDASDDTVLYSKNADERMYPASITKVMSAIVILKNLPLEVLVSRSATMTAQLSRELTAQSAAVAGLKIDEEVTLKDLFYAMMLPSGADATILLAENTFGGDMNKFVEQMNVVAKEIGMNNTHFTNPTGLHDDNQYSTPRDLAIMGQYAMYSVTNSLFFREVVNTKSYVIKTNKRPFGFTLQTRNLLLTTLNTSGVNGIKTGTTTQAGECLLTSYENSTMNVIAVVLGSKPGKKAERQVFTDTKNLITYIKSNFKVIRDLKKVPSFSAKVALATSTEENKEFKFTTDGDVRFVIPTNSEEKITFEPTGKLNLIAPIKAKKEIATVKVMLEGNELGTVSLTNPKDISISIKYIFMGIALVIFIIVVIVILISVLSSSSRTKKRKKKKQPRALR